MKQQARTIDFLPTLLAVMGGRAEDGVQGLDLMPSRSPGSESRRTSDMPRRFTRR